MSCACEGFTGVYVIDADHRQKVALAIWFLHRPEIIKVLCRAFPPGSYFYDDKGKRFWVVKYFEDGGIGVTTIDPLEDWGTAVADQNVEHICPDCVTSLRLLAAKHADNALRVDGGGIVLPPHGGVN